MNLHEYQSKRLFADFGIPVPRGIPAETAEAAVAAAARIAGTLTGSTRLPAPMNTMSSPPSPLDVPPLAYISMEIARMSAISGVIV